MRVPGTKRMKRVVLKIAGIGIVAIVLAGGALLFWLFGYSGDLPDVKSLAQYAPVEAVQVRDACTGVGSVAIPYNSIGENLRAALSAAEAGENDSGVLADMLRSFTNHSTPGRVPLSLQISRSMFCAPSKRLNRGIEEVRTAFQLERHFSRRELFTIYANRTWFGNEIVGVEGASERYFQKKPDQLQIGEAALLAGLLRSPARYSPHEHPDRALQRRNEVVDAMVVAHAISVEEGKEAKVKDLGIAMR